MNSIFEAYCTDKRALQLSIKVVSFKRLCAVALKARFKNANILALKRPSNSQKPKAIKSFGIIISPLLESANIKPQNIEKHFTPNTPAWCMKPPEILFYLRSGKKSESNPHILKDDFRKNAKSL